MRVLKTTSSEGETASYIDLFSEKNVPDEAKDGIRDDVGAFLIEQTLIAVADAKSPVSGESFPALKKGPYRTRKEDEVGTTKADLQNSGETLDELDFKPIKEGIKLGVFGDRAPIADGHNNFSGKSTLPRRRFLPGEDQSYKSDIAKEVDRIIMDAIKDFSPTIKKGDFKDVNSLSSLLKVLKEVSGTTSSTEAVRFALRDEDLLDLLIEEDLLRFIR